MIVDNSVAVKWFVPEDGTEEAMSLYGEGLRAPDLLAIEFANVMRTKIAKRELSEEQAREAIRVLGLALPRLDPSQPLVGRAFEIALELSHSVYDCVYVALAEREESQMVTADRRLAVRAKGTPFEGLVRPL